MWENWLGSIDVNKKKKRIGNKFAQNKAPFRLYRRSDYASPPSKTIWYLTYLLD